MFFFLLFFTIFLNRIGFSQQVDSLSYNIINTFPSPRSSPQGIAWDGNFLWVADDSTDSLYKLNPSDGLIISTLPTPGPDPRGLTWDGNYLWCSDDRKAKIFKLNPTDGSVIYSIPAPASPPHNNIYGLTWDGQYLWSAYSAGWSSRINQVDPMDGTVIRSFCSNAEGMAFYDTFLWIVESHSRTKGNVYKYDFSGNWLAYFITPGYSPTGLTYDGTYFWLSDSKTDTIYQIEILTSNIESSHKDSSTPSSFVLYNYPNPFNQQTIIFYELPYDSKVSLRILNINGQLIKTLENEEKKTGLHWVYWDGKNNLGRYVPSGFYLYHIETEDFSKSMKMILVR